VEFHLTAIECHLPYGITQFCHPTQVNTPHLNPSQTGRYSIYLSRRDEMLSWPMWLVTYWDDLPSHRPQTVTFPSTNRAQCRLTTLIAGNALTTTLRRHLLWAASICGFYIQWCHC